MIDQQNTQTDLNELAEEIDTIYRQYVHANTRKDKHILLDEYNRLIAQYNSIAGRKVYHKI